MESTNSRQPNESMLEDIFKLMLQYGFKALTMDIVAQSLQMSKRTLYEIFENKSEMTKLALMHTIRTSNEKQKKEFEQSGNVLLTMTNMFVEHLDFVKRANVDFFCDMDKNFMGMRDVQRTALETRVDVLDEFYRRGVEQGLLRADVNMRILQRMLHLQFESLKRMEEIFESEFTLQEVCCTIFISFMRSVATLKGLAIIDEICKDPRYGLSSEGIFKDKEKQ